jgi:hypothetical protein
MAKLSFIFITAKVGLILSMIGQRNRRIGHGSVSFFPPLDRKTQAKKHKTQEVFKTAKI